MLPMMVITATADTQYNDVLSSIQGSMGLGPESTVPLMILGAIAVLALVLVGLKAIRKFIDTK